ncbi:MAG: SGNH/GDSL hydrolase family protein [Caldimonas sp.]
MPSSRSASPISPGSDGDAAASASAAKGGRGGTAGAEPRLASPALSLAFKLVLAPLLVVQAVRTRRRAPLLPEAAGPRDGRTAGDGVAVRVLVAGDSSAAGVGVAHQDQAVVGYLVRTLARHRPGPVEWCLRARSGLTTRGVHALLVADPPLPADVAFVVSGVNDVIDQIPAGRAVRDRAALADWLLERGLARRVVFAPLPPMHQFPLLPEPLRRVIGADARRHDQALARWAATRSDVEHVPIAIALTAETMASDGFHPGEPVYRACGEALALHIAATEG